ncbi:MAG: tetratricopeptide repeat protein [Microbacteriaceae bacterium]
MVGYSIDDDSLRDFPDNIEKTWSHVRKLEALGQEGDTERISWLRQLGELVSAEKLAWDVMERITGTRDLSKILTKLDEASCIPLIRLGHVMFWQKRFDLAESIFQAVIRFLGAIPHPSQQIRSEFSLAHQLLGKNLYEQNDYQSAFAEFELALELRMESPMIDDQLAASRQALNATQRRIKANEES